MIPTEELELRQAAHDAWRMTWGQAPPETLTPEQAFNEGHYLALACGVMACRRTRAECRLRVLRLEAERCAVFAVGFLAVAAAGVWVAVR